MNDPLRAAHLCNALIKSYVELRRVQQLMPMHAKLQALTEQLERSPDDANLKRQMQELELATRTTELEARPLDECAPRAARKP